MNRRRSPYLVYDSFNRADGLLGNAETGQAWNAAAGFWRIISNRAGRLYADTTNSNAVSIDCGKSNIVVSAKITMTTNSVGTCLVARMGNDSSTNNSVYLRITPAGSIEIVRKTGSYTPVVMASSTFTFVDGATYACELSCKGNDFIASINGVVKATATEADVFTTNTKVGMLMPLNNTAAYDFFDDFMVRE